MGREHTPGQRGDGGICALQSNESNYYELCFFCLDTFVHHSLSKCKYYLPGIHKNRRQLHSNQSSSSFIKNLSGTAFSAYSTLWHGTVKPLFGCQAQRHWKQRKGRRKKCVCHHPRGTKARSQYTKSSGARFHKRIKDKTSPFVLEERPKTTTHGEIAISHQKKKSWTSIGKKSEWSLQSKETPAYNGHFQR